MMEMAALFAATAWAMALVPTANFGKLEDAGGAVPDDGAGGRDDFLDRGDGLGADVEALPVGGEVLRGIPRLGFGVGEKLSARMLSTGSSRLTPFAFAFSSVCLGHVDLVFFDEGLAGGDAEGALEGVGHAADDDQGVDLVEEVLDDVDLAGDLGAADDGDEGLFRGFERLAEIGDFLFHQQAGDGGLEEMRDAFGGGVGAVRGAEGVVDVDLGERGELLLRTRDRWLLLRRGSGGFRAAAPGRDSSWRAISSAISPTQSGEKATLIAVANVLVEQLAQAIDDGAQRVLRIRLALGTAEVRGENDLGVVPERVLDGGQRGDDAGVVGDGPSRLR